jgi:hypothetical protein
MKIEPHQLRAALLDQATIQNESARVHALYIKKLGLVDQDGLTPAGFNHAALIKDRKKFETGLARIQTTFNTNDWSILIWQLRRLK